MPKYKRYRFKTKSLDDYRPLKDMTDINCPWWCSGEGKDFATIICFLPYNVDLKEYWDDAYNIEVKEREEIIYTSRFLRPDWIKED